MAMKDIIREKIEKALAPEILEVINESHLHKGHAGDDGSGESHFKLKVVSSAFVGKTKIECHRMINQILSEELKTRIHALSLDLKPLQ